MKSLILILTGIFILFLGGCGTSETVTQKDYDLAREKTATVGSTMLSYISAKSEIFKSNKMNTGTKEELVYTGKSGSTIKIDYRQYYIYDGEWYMDDGFPLHLEYDLSSGNVISCKYYRIRILTADNNEIKFIVIQD